MNNKMIDNNPPKVFVSYSHDCQEHKDWVLKLSSDLRHHGVDVVLDQWDARLGDDLPFFMEQGLTTSSLVLCICSDIYTEKANANKGGAGYEKKILTADLMNSSSDNFIIPIKRHNNRNKIPTFLGGTFYADFSDDSRYFDSYEKLLARIHNEDISAKPHIGVNPFKNNSLSRDISYTLDIKKTQFYNPSFCGEVSFDYTQNNHDFIIGEGEYQFITHWSTAGMGCIHCYKDKVKRLGYNPKYTQFPPKEEIIHFGFSSRCRTIQEGQVVVLENNYNKFVAIKVVRVFRNSVDIGHLLEFEFKIYNDIE